MPAETNLPLSAQQEFHWETLWFREGDVQSGGRDGPFIAFKLSGKLDTEAFARAIEVVTDAHETLRVRFCGLGRNPSQRVVSEVKTPLSVIDLSRIPEDRRTQLTQNLIAAENRSNFDLISGPLWTAHLLVLSGTEYVFAMHFCHLVLDGLSLIALLHDISTVYNGGHLHSRRSYRSAVEASLKIPGDLEERLEFWRRRLPPRFSSIRYPVDQSEPLLPFVSTAIQTFESSLGKDDILAITRASSATTFTKYLAAYAIMIALQSGNGRVVFGSSTSIANPLADDHALGYHLNLLLIPVTVRRDESLAVLLSQIGETVSRALELTVPYRRLAREIHARFDEQRPWPAMLLYDAWVRGRVFGSSVSDQAEGLSLNGVNANLYSLTRGYSDWQLVNEMQRKAAREHVLPSLYIDNAEGSSGYFEYNCALYKSPTIRDMARRVDLLIKEMIRPEQTINDAWRAAVCEPR